MNFLPPPNRQRYQEQVWAFVRQIPYGRVATYGQIMQAIPVPDGISATDYRMSGARWVGMAMAACPNDVPWQRVVNSQGKISHKSEAAKQKQLLQAEGVLFSNEKLDLDVYQWLGPQQSDLPVQRALF